MNTILARHSIAIALAVAALAPSSAEAADTIPTNNPSACMEGALNQFGRYIGNWNMTDETLSPDGKSWIKGPGARWNFVCLGNGTAIQDFWIPAQGEVGTNLRTYDPSTQSWHIAWAVKPQPGYSQITARLQPNDTIVMHYEKPVPTPLRRITFYPPTESGWNWTLEFSNDKGTTWRVVYRMSANRAE